MPAVADEKPWWRTWGGAPDWARAGERLLDVIAKAPDGQEYDVLVRPVAVSMPGNGWDTMLWAFGWLVHALRYRGRWEVDILLRPRPLRSFFKALVTKPWIYDGYRSKQEANAAVLDIARKIEIGTWTPGDRLMPGE